MNRNATVAAILLLLLAVASCGGDDEAEVPSCQAAVTSYYAADCAYYDLNTGEQIPAANVIDLCRDTLGVASCDSELEAWVVCMDTVGPDCDCSSEAEALISC